MSVETRFAIPSQGCLALLWPAVDQCLIGQSVRPQLETVAAAIAPVGRIAVELRLAPGLDDVDFHQFLSGEADAAILSRHLAQGATWPPGDEQSNQFLRAWADDLGGLRADVDHLFLEWDLPRPGETDRAPAIFLPVQGRFERGAAGITRRDIFARHLTRLGLGGPRLAQRVREIMESIPADASVSYAGFMLGRSAEAVRINLRGIRPADLPNVLDDIAWPGDHGAWQPYFSSLVERADTVAVALDFAPDLQATIGFEAALDGLPGSEPRWPQLLDHLTEKGLCAPDKGAALKQVGARLYPEQEGQMWPASWLAAAAMAPPHCVPWFERRLSHVKVSISSEGRAVAKAYLSAQHHWSRVDRRKPPSAKPGAEPAEAAALERSAGRAMDFLSAARSQDDLWRDFRLVNGMSDEWVSGFVGFALAIGAGPGAHASLGQTASALLNRQRADGGWGYNAISPSDADSTAWVLKLLARLGRGGAAAAHGHAFLRSHLLPGGGFATYAPSTPISFGDDQTPDDSGWRGSHVCVAANAADLLPEPLLGLLRSEQRLEGHWTAYWWRNDRFATALAVEALSTAADRESRRRACAWARTELAEARSAFDRACLIQILCAGGSDDRRKAREACSALAAEQRDDGSWAPGAEMLFTHPSARTRSGGDSVIIDHRGLFTTASVLMAITRVGGLEQRS